MLARRFTIVCLLVMIFGMGLSMLVAEKSRSGTRAFGASTSCDVANLARCAPLTRH